MNSYDIAKVIKKVEQMSFFCVKKIRNYLQAKRG